MATSITKIRRALLTVTDKKGIQQLAQALAQSGAEVVATGNTARVIEEGGTTIVPIEKISGSPEAFQGRMKTLSFPVCSGILYRRGDAQDEQDLQKLSIAPIDCVVVNFYPFVETARAARERGETDPWKWVEQIDIGGPTLVRSAAKNAPQVLVLTDPEDYATVIEELKQHGGFTAETALRCARKAWQKIHEYDAAIAAELGTGRTLPLRYGENPHQTGYLEVHENSPVDWTTELTPNALSYNNILDFSGAYGLASELVGLDEDSTGVVVVKHNNPCGVALVPRSHENAQKTALLRAWEGDPISAFGGVLVFTDPIEEETAQWLSERFVELVAAPGLEGGSPALQTLLKKRKKLKALNIFRFQELPSPSVVAVPGGKLWQSADVGVSEDLRPVTKAQWPADKEAVARFGIAVCRALKSNTIAIVREIPQLPGALQLVGAGQGQPNRVEALRLLAVPRAQAVLREVGGRIEDCVMISDAFFPFRDTVDEAYRAGLRFVVQPGGSIKDGESIAACDEHGMAMVFTGVRHFRH